MNRRRHKLTYVLADYVMLNVGWLLFTLVRYWVLPETYTSHYSFLFHITSLPVVGGQLLFPLMMLCLYWLSGYYNTVYFKSRIDEAVNTAAVSAAGAIVIFFAVLLNDGVPERLHNYEMILTLWLCLTVPVYAERVTITNNTLRRIRSKHIVFNTLIAGSTQQAHTLIAKLEKSHFTNGIDIVGYLSTNEAHTFHADKPVYALNDIQRVVSDRQIQYIVVVPDPNDKNNTIKLINKLLPLNITLFVTPDLYGLIAMRPRISDVVGEPLVNISNPSASAMTLNCKRTADVIVSALALTVLSPLFIAIAIAIRCDSKGPVIYKQERIGLNNKPFDILKFRTMRVDAEKSGPALSTVDDPRITRIGHFLRKYRLDELPQFYNVLRGEMSLVGPRPERHYYIEQIMQRVPYYTLVHRIRPGITSWGMVKYGYASTVEQMVERLRYDLLYLENISLVVDVKILFHTINTVLTGKGL